MMYLTMKQIDYSKIDLHKIFPRPTDEELREGMRRRHRGQINREMLNKEEHARN